MPFAPFPAAKAAFAGLAAFRRLRGRGLRHPRRAAGAALLLAMLGACDAPTQPDATRVMISTSLGDITLRLEPEKAPVTVQNFLAYIDRDGYQGTLFHRVIPGFMVQGGGFDQNLEPVTADPPILNEADNGLRNLKGTIAMARTGVVDSATRQFFINVQDNPHLDHAPDSCTRQQLARGETPCPSFGYAVFGRVESGMDVVERIVMADTTTDTTTETTFQRLPVEDIVINRITRL